MRCHGFVSDDWVHCSREEHAGKANFSQKSRTYAHRARGPCPCGEEHAPADPKPRGRKNRGTIDKVYIYRDSAGQVLFEVVRFRDPKDFSQRRPLPNGKYAWSLDGVAKVLYRLPELLAADPAEIVWVCEGEKDADSVASLGFVATTNPMGARKWRDGYSGYLEGRRVVILQHNDQAGRDHAQQVAKSLHGKAASVRILELPDLPEHGDVTDFLEAGGMEEDLRELAAKAPEWTPPATDPATDPPAAGKDPASPAPQSYYCVENGRLCRMASGRDGSPFSEPITNFNAWITEEVVRDDGAEQSRLLSVAGKSDTGAPMSTIQVPIDEFIRGDWPLKYWGFRAVVRAGQGSKDHMRAAIQTLSREAGFRTIFTHVGWRRIGGAWYYLHAAGAIGTVGTEDIVVDPPDSLQHFALPTPPEGTDRVAAIGASLGILKELAPDRVVMPLVALVYRAPLPNSNNAGHLSGRTGGGKTQMAALAQQHFGAAMDAARLPASWSSTANALESMAFAARDAILVIDDFCPTGGNVEISRLHATADRVIRAQGNRSGRQRLRADGSHRPTRPPQGTILSTGEDVPKGHSLRARLLTIEVEPDDVKFPRLSACQADAAAGLYAAAMAAYLLWLADRYDERVGDFKAESLRLRGELSAAGQHRRTPAMIGEMIAGFNLFIRFATEAGAVTEAEASSLRERCRKSLLESASAQAAHQRDSDPCERYFHLLRSALVSGRGHVTGIDGSRPAQSPESWGWRLGEDREWRPQGRHVGWLDDADLYLEPEAAYALVNSLAGEQNESLATTKTVMHKRLHEAGRLVAVDKSRDRLTIRKKIGDARPDVLHLRAAGLLGVQKTVPNVPNVPMGEKRPENGTVSWDGFPEVGENRPTETSHFPGGKASVGTNGTVGTVPGTDESPPYADESDREERATIEGTHDSFFVDPVGPDREVFEL